MEDTRQRLIGSAGQVFADKGFDAASVREICDRAAANIAAVNYHFGDKRKLYIACVREAQCCQSGLMANPQWPADAAPDLKLRGFIRQMFESQLDRTRPRWHLELMLREMTRPTEACAEVVRDYIRPMAELLSGILRELIPGLGDRRQGWMLGFSVVGQILMYYVHRPILRDLMGADDFDRLTTDDLTDHVFQFTLAALGYAGSAPFAVRANSSDSEISHGQPAPSMTEAP